MYEKKENNVPTKELITIQKKIEKNSTIDIFFAKHGDKISMFKNVKEVDEEKITK